jgi:hypothetical protein
MNSVPRAEEVNKEFISKKYLITSFTYLPKYASMGVLFSPHDTFLVQLNRNDPVPDGTDRIRLLTAPDSNFKGIT